MAMERLGIDEYEPMRRAGRVAAETLAAIVSRVRPGISTADIDAWVRADTAMRGAEPSQLGFRGFPAAVCTSRNEIVCHGVPRQDELIVEGDIINIDVTSCLHGYHGDTSVTVEVGQAPEASRLVLDVARRALQIAVELAAPGLRIGDLGAAIEDFAHRNGCTVVRNFGGHGIGRAMHQPPHIPHHGPAGRGPRLRTGMAFTIEPMITIGDPKLRILDDGWTVVTADGSPSAQFEHTLLVTEAGVEVLTRPV